MGVRSKFCARCAIVTNERIDVPQHKCYRNWSGTSAAMESDIIAEGFTMSEQMYGQQYMSVIVDGDSSMMATIWQMISYGSFVSWIEFANCACKAYRSRPEALAEDNLEYRGKGRLKQRAMQRLTGGARIAIIKHSVTKNNIHLSYDLRNEPLPVYGNHTDCIKDLCTFQQNPSVHDDESNEKDEPTVSTTAEQTIEEWINTVIQTETELQISPQGKHGATQDGHASLINNLAQGIFNTVANVQIGLYH